MQIVKHTDSRLIVQTERLVYVGQKLRMRSSMTHPLLPIGNVEVLSIKKYADVDSGVLKEMYARNSYKAQPWIEYSYMGYTDTLPLAVFLSHTISAK